jgi:hypothetical protein
MSVSAASSIQPSGMPDSLVPRLPSEIANSSASDKSNLHMFAEDDDSASFWDVLDVINPLQHIPIINDLYREATGDKIGVGARLVGGALFGGPLGLVGAAVNAVMEEATGKDVGSHLIALFRDDEPASTGTALASTQVPDPSVASAVAVKAVANDQSTVARSLILPGMAGDDAISVAAPSSLAKTAMVAPPPPLAAPLAPVSQATALDVASGAQASPAQSNQLAALPVDAAEGKPMPLWAGRQPRLMPVPSRTTLVATKSPPAVGTSISQGGMRSNTPVTGARSNQQVMSPAMVQEMAAVQSSANAANSASGDWFSGAMMQGLSKYDRNAKMGQRSGTSVSESQ